MITIRTLAIAFASAVACCGFSPTASAKTLDQLIYEDNGTSITITGHEYLIQGAVVIPSSIEGKPVTAIESRALSYASRVKSVSIPSTVTRIGDAAFEICNSMRTVNIPSGVTEIRAGTFSGCSLLGSITIPSGVSNIGIRAFSGCQALTDVTLPSGITRISDSMFERCFALEKISIPSTVTAIGASSFASCRKLGNVTIPKDVLTIGDRAFQGCQSFTRITLPSKVTAIGDNSFSSTGVTEVVTLSPALKSIGRGAFQRCFKLTRVTIPGKVSEIGSEAFGDCPLLLSAGFLGNAPSMGSEVFNSSGPGFKIFVSDTSQGFTYPIWRGYRTSLPTAEIAISAPDGGNLVAAESSQLFASTLVGQAGKKVTFTITNAGTRKLEHLSVRKQGSDTADYVITNLPPVSLEPGKRAKFSVIFSPKAAGKRIAMIRVISNDEDESPFEIKLKGLGIIFLN